VVWYKAFRAATYAGLLGALVWTVLLVLPFRPFSYLLPIVEHEGPGTWFLLAYLLFLIVGLAGFGVLSSLLYTIETQENRKPNQSVMLSGYVLLVIGVFASCFLLAFGGALGGYAETVNNETTSAVQSILSVYVLPITTTALMTVLGAALTFVGMASARSSSSKIPA
jgi:hypothetical protein